MNNAKLRITKTTNYFWSQFWFEFKCVKKSARKKCLKANSKKSCRKLRKPLYWSNLQVFRFNQMGPEWGHFYARGLQNGQRRHKRISWGSWGLKQKSKLDASAHFFHLIRTCFLEHWQVRDAAERLSKSKMGPMLKNRGNSRGNK
jgi:hypothetical protein